MAGKVDFDVISLRSRRHFHRKFHGLLGAAAVEFADGAMTIVWGVTMLLRGKTTVARKCWSHFKALFRAFRPSVEDRLAREGHRRAQFNGRGPDSGPAEPTEKRDNACAAPSSTPVS